MLSNTISQPVHSQLTVVSVYLSVFFCWPPIVSNIINLKSFFFSIFFLFPSDLLPVYIFSYSWNHLSLWFDSRQFSTEGLCLNMSELYKLQCIIKFLKFRVMKFCFVCSVWREPYFSCIQITHCWSCRRHLAFAPKCTFLAAFRNKNCWLCRCHLIFASKQNQHNLSDVNQNQSNYSRQSQSTETIQWTNQIPK